MSLRRKYARASRRMGPSPEMLEALRLVRFEDHRPPDAERQIAETCEAFGVPDLVSPESRATIARKMGQPAVVIGWRGDKLIVQCPVQWGHFGEDEPVTDGDVLLEPSPGPGSKL